MNKAAGPNDIDPEHLCFGGPRLVSVLTLLFNVMMLACHIPLLFAMVCNHEGPQQGPIQPLQSQGDHHSVECEQVVGKAGDLEDQ